MLKRFIISVLLIAVTLSLSACGKDNKLVSPVAYYYLRSNIQFDGDNSVIHAEMRESAGFENNLAYLLRLYLIGPNSDGYKSPFPYNVNLISLSYDDTSLVATFNGNFGALFGLELTLASVCFSKTAMELSGATSVKIQLEHGLLDGKAYILIDSASVQYWDDYTLHTE